MQFSYSELENPPYGATLILGYPRLTISRRTSSKTQKISKELSTSDTRNWDDIFFALSDGFHIQHGSGIRYTDLYLIL